MAADREKFEAWLSREMRGPRYASLTDKPTCHGGPIDGMFAAVAEGAFRVVGAALHVPSLLVLQSGVEGPVKLEHRYARRPDGAFVYAGLSRLA